MRRWEEDEEKRGKKMRMRMAGRSAAFYVLDALEPDHESQAPADRTITSLPGHSPTLDKRWGESSLLWVLFTMNNSIV